MEHQGRWPVLFTHFQKSRFNDHCGSIRYSSRVACSGECASTGDKVIYDPSQAAHGCRCGVVDMEGCVTPLSASVHADQMRWPVRQLIMDSLDGIMSAHTKPGNTSQQLRTPHMQRLVFALLKSCAPHIRSHFSRHTNPVLTYFSPHRIASKPARILQADISHGPISCAVR